MLCACRLTLRFHPWTREICRCAWRSTSLATRHARCLASTSRAIGLSGLRRTAQRMGCLLRVSAGPHCSAPGSARLAEACGPLTALGVHRRCIDRWLRANVHCPLCKTPERTPLNSTRVVRIGACTAVGMVRARLTITEYMHHSLVHASDPRRAAHAIRPAELRWGRTHASLGGSMRNGSRRLAVARVALGRE